MPNACSSEFQRKHFGFAGTSAEDFYACQWFDNRLPFIAYRLFFFLYCLCWTISSTVVLSKYEDVWIFLTWWGECSLVFYFGLAFAVSMYGFIQSLKKEKGALPAYSGGMPKGDDLRWFHKLTWALSASTAASAYVITAMFWAFLSKLPVHSVPINIHQHAMNSVLITIDIFMSRVPVRYLHLIYVIIFGAAYSSFGLVLHWSGYKSVIYKDLLDWGGNVGASLAVTFGVAFVGLPATHAIAFGFYHLRAYIANRIFFKPLPKYTQDETELAEARMIATSDT